MQSFRQSGSMGCAIEQANIRTALSITSPSHKSGLQYCRVFESSVTVVHKEYLLLRKAIQTIYNSYIRQIILSDAPIATISRYLCFCLQDQVLVQSAQPHAQSTIAPFEHHGS